MINLPFFLTSVDDPIDIEPGPRAPGSPRHGRKPRGWGYRRLARFKVEGGIKHQLHATRGWKPVGRVGQ